MVLVLVEEITNRLTYTFDFIFKSRGITYELTTRRDIFNDSSFKKLNYSTLETREKQIVPSDLLNQNEIVRQVLGVENYLNEPTLSFNGALDPIASVFYVLTRYEEYIEGDRDVHNRFPFTESILKKYNWIEKAKCDRWARLIVHFIGEEVEEERVEIIPTFDIDNTFAYQLKKGKQKNLSILKDIVNLNFNRLLERKRVLKGEIDPYNTFEIIKKTAKRFPNTKVFWLVGGRSKKDRNIPISNKDHQDLVQEMNDAVSVNLHPSYASNSNSDLILEEKKALEKVLGHSVNNSRQHFLRFKLPETFQAILDVGFTSEYSMGFAESLGFRSGTARKHFWFDLSKNKVTKLTIHPFVYMDGTLNEYMKLTVEESKGKIEELYKEVQEFGGDFVFLWHNETIGNYGKWKGWSEVLEFTLNLDNE